LKIHFEFPGTLLTNANKPTASSNSAGAAGVQESSTSINTSISYSTRQYQTMSLVNGTYYMEVDVQVGLAKIIAIKSALNCGYINKFSGAKNSIKWHILQSD
jgi:hypothetical protein